MTSHAGGGVVGYKLVYILYSAGGCGGMKDKASTGMRNNVKLIMETLGWAGGLLYKAKR